MKGKPFRKSVIWFCLINIWIVISWSVWRYGGSYSTRALVQSYPVFALALAGFLTWILSARFKLGFYALAIYLTAVNLFQIWQYRQGILRHDEMNRAYYQAVYLDRNPTPLDMSMLDGGEKIEFEKGSATYYNNVVTKKEIEAGKVFYDEEIPGNTGIEFLLDVRSITGFWRGYIVITVKDKSGREIKVKKFRMFNYLTRSNKINRYHIQLKMPKETDRVEMKFGGGEDIVAKVRSLIVKG